MVTLTEEVKSDAKLLGYFEYKTGLIVCFVLLLIALGLVFAMFDEEQRFKYLIVGAFNVMCLAVTYKMRGQLDKRAQERAERQEAKAEWEAKSE